MSIPPFVFRGIKLAAFHLAGIGKIESTDEQAVCNMIRDCMIEEAGKIEPMPAPAPEPEPINSGGPAFPVGIVDDDHSPTMQNWEGHPGMSLRDYFAGQALVGLIGNEAGAMKATATNDVKCMTQWAYIIATDMIRARDMKP